MHDQTELLYTTYAAGSGASQGAGRILRACHSGSGRILMEDLFRLDPERQQAALALLVTTIRHGADGIPLSQDRIDALFRDKSLV